MKKFSIIQVIIAVVLAIQVLADKPDGADRIRTGVVLTDGVVDTSLAQYYTITLTNDITWTFRGHSLGRVFWLNVIQDSIGGWTNSWGPHVIWPNGIRQQETTVPNTSDLFRFVYDGSNWLGLLDGGNYTTNSSHALKFDGVQNYVSVSASSALSPQGSFTIEFWEKGMTREGAQFVNQYDNWYSQLNGGQFEFHLHFASAGWVVLTAGAPTDSAWHHVAAVYDGAMAKLYLDGTQVASSTASSDHLQNSALTLTFAAGNDLNPVTFGNEVLDEIRISQVARYPANFSPATSFQVDPDTVAYWRLNEGIGTIASDATGNHNGTLQGNPPPAWVSGR